eukprot:761782-Hanusia_phi.AAC.10
MLYTSVPLICSSSFLSFIVCCSGNSCSHLLVKSSPSCCDLTGAGTGGGARYEEANDGGWMEQCRWISRVVTGSRGGEAIGGGGTHRTCPRQMLMRAGTAQACVLSEAMAGTMSTREGEGGGGRKIVDEGRR